MHWGLILLLFVVAFVAQYAWRQSVKRGGAENIIPNSMAEKLSIWMFQKRGLLPPDAPGGGQPGIEQVMCDTCSGSGMRVGDDGKLEPCGICYGVGSRWVRRFSADDFQCPACGGMGRVEIPGSGEIVECPRCGGRGLVLDTGGEEDAPKGATENHVR